MPSVNDLNILDPRERDLAIRTIYGEAAREPDEGKAAVAAVIRNRVLAGRYGGDTVRSVVLAKNQFEPWNGGPARARMLALRPGTPDYDRIGDIVDGIWSGQVPDPTKGATHFFAPAAQAALGRNVPAWARGQQGQAIGRHTFYAPEGRVTGAETTQKRVDFAAFGQGDEPEAADLASFGQPDDEAEEPATPATPATVSKSPTAKAGEKTDMPAFAPSNEAAKSNVPAKPARPGTEVDLSSFGAPETATKVKPIGMELGGAAKLGQFAPTSEQEDVARDRGAALQDLEAMDAFANRPTPPAFQDLRKDEENNLLGTPPFERGA